MLNDMYKSLNVNPDSSANVVKQVGPVKKVSGGNVTVDVTQEGLVDAATQQWDELSRMAADSAEGIKNYGLISEGIAEGEGDQKKDIALWNKEQEHIMAATTAAEDVRNNLPDSNGNNLYEVQIGLNENGSPVMATYDLNDPQKREEAAGMAYQKRLEGIDIVSTRGQAAHQGHLRVQADRMRGLTAESADKDVARIEEIYNEFLSSEGIDYNPSLAYNAWQNNAEVQQISTRIGMLPTDQYWRQQQQLETLQSGMRFSQVKHQKEEMVRDITALTNGQVKGLLDEMADVVVDPSMDPSQKAGFILYALNEQGLLTPEVTASIGITGGGDVAWGVASGSPTESLLTDPNHNSWKKFLNVVLNSSIASDVEQSGLSPAFVETAISNAVNLRSSDINGYVSQNISNIKDAVQKDREVRFNLAQQRVREITQEKYDSSSQSRLGSQIQIMGEQSFGAAGLSSDAFADGATAAAIDVLSAGSAGPHRNVEWVTENFIRGLLVDTQDGMFDSQEQLIDRANKRRLVAGSRLNQFLEGRDDGQGYSLVDSEGRINEQGARFLWREYQNLAGKIRNDPAYQARVMTWFEVAINLAPGDANALDQTRVVDTMVHAISLITGDEYSDEETAVIAARLGALGEEDRLALVELIPELTDKTYKQFESILTRVVKTGQAALGERQAALTKAIRDTDGILEVDKKRHGRLLVSTARNAFLVGTNSAEEMSLVRELDKHFKYAQATGTALSYIVGDEYSAKLLDPFEAVANHISHLHGGLADPALEQDIMSMYLGYKNTLGTFALTASHLNSMPGVKLDTASLPDNVEPIGMFLQNPSKAFVEADTDGDGKMELSISPDFASSIAVEASRVWAWSSDHRLRGNTEYESNVQSYLGHIVDYVHLLGDTTLEPDQRMKVATSLHAIMYALQPLEYTADTDAPPMRSYSLVEREGNAIVKSTIEIPEVKMGDIARNLLRLSDMDDDATTVSSITGMIASSDDVFQGFDQDPVTAGEEFHYKIFKNGSKVLGTIMLSGMTMGRDGSDATRRIGAYEIKVDGQGLVTDERNKPGILTRWIAQHGHEISDIRTAMLARFAQEKMYGGETKNTIDYMKEMIDVAVRNGFGNDLAVNPMTGKRETLYELAAQLDPNSGSYVENNWYTYAKQQSNKWYGKYDHLDGPSHTTSHAFAGLDDEEKITFRLSEFDDVLLNPGADFTGDIGLSMEWGGDDIDFYGGEGVPVAGYSSILIAASRAAHTYANETANAYGGQTLSGAPGYYQNAVYQQIPEMNEMFEGTGDPNLRVGSLSAHVELMKLHTNRNSVVPGMTRYSQPITVPMQSSDGTTRFRTQRNLNPEYRGKLSALGHTYLTQESIDLQGERYPLYAGAELPAMSFLLSAPSHDNEIGGTRWEVAKQMIEQNTGMTMAQYGQAGGDIKKLHSWAMDPDMVNMQFFALMGKDVFDTANSNMFGGAAPHMGPVTDNLSSNTSVFQTRQTRSKEGVGVPIIDTNETNALGHVALKAVTVEGGNPVTIMYVPPELFETGTSPGNKRVAQRLNQLSYDYLTFDETHTGRPRRFMGMRKNWLGMPVATVPPGEDPLQGEDQDMGHPAPVWDNPDEPFFKTINQYWRHR